VNWPLFYRGQGVNRAKSFFEDSEYTDLIRRSVPFGVSKIGTLATI
jgi:hypothetical protein